MSNPLLLCVAGCIGGQAESTSATLHDSAKPNSDSAIPDFNFTEPSEEDCPLCREWDTLRYTELGRVLFSVKPYKWGHLMVIPNRHVATLALCSEEEACCLLRLVSEAASVCGAAKTVGQCFCNKFMLLPLPLLLRQRYGYILFEGIFCHLCIHPHTFKKHAG